MSMMKEFKTFAMRGNVIDMAVGIVIGGAFGKIVSSFVADVIMPPIGLLLGGVDFSNLFAVIREGSSAGPFANLAAAQILKIVAKRTARITRISRVQHKTVCYFILRHFFSFLCGSRVPETQQQAQSKAM